MKVADRATERDWIGRTRQSRSVLATSDSPSPACTSGVVADAIAAEIEPQAWERSATAEAAELDSLRSYMDAWVRSSSRQAAKYSRRGRARSHA